MWFAGIDWADDHHDVVVIDGEARQVGVRRVRHTSAGLTELTEFLASITGPGRREELACIVETTHGLLIAALLAAGFPVYPVNPKTVDRKRGAAGAKTEHSIALAAGYTSLYCPNNVKKTFSLLYAKTRVKRMHAAPDQSGIRIYQIRVILPDKSEQMIDFPSKEAHFELRSGDEVIIAFFKERPKVVMNVTIRQYMLAAYS